MSIIESEQDGYLDLVRGFPLLPIDSDEGLDRAIAVINSLLDKPALSPGEQGYLDVLSDLVEKYETIEHPIIPVSDGEMLRHLIEAKGVSDFDVAVATDLDEPTIRNVLSGQRQLSREQIAKLARYFTVNPTVFSFDFPQESQAE